MTSLPPDDRLSALPRRRTAGRRNALRWNANWPTTGTAAGAGRARELRNELQNLPRRSLPDDFVRTVLQAAEQSLLKEPLPASPPNVRSWQEVAPARDAALAPLAAAEPEPNSTGSNVAGATAFPPLPNSPAGGSAPSPPPSVERAPARSGALPGSPYGWLSAVAVLAASVLAILLAPAPDRAPTSIVWEGVPERELARQRSFEGGRGSTFRWNASDGLAAGGNAEADLRGFSAAGGAMAESQLAGMEDGNDLATTASPPPPGELPSTLRHLEIRHERGEIAQTPVLTPEPVAVVYLETTADYWSSGEFHRLLADKGVRWETVQESNDETAKSAPSPTSSDVAASSLPARSSQQRSQQLPPDVDSQEPTRRGAREASPCPPLPSHRYVFDFRERPRCHSSTGFDRDAAIPLVGSSGQRGGAASANAADPSVRSSSGVARRQAGSGRRRSPALQAQADSEQLQPVERIPTVVESRD